jgi:hypothetical protein
MIDALSDRPDIGKALRRELEGFWSARVGRQRVIYQWSRARLDVVLVGPRATIYEEASRLGRAKPRTWTGEPMPNAASLIRRTRRGR